tara:strand:+ start:112 stop:516 length:405 start_codon:yes stop_codon:yes gene_type:complete
MPTVTALKALITKFEMALELDKTQRAMSKEERARYEVKLQQATTKLAQLEGSDPAVSSVQHQGNKHPAASRAHVIRVAMTNNYGRRQSGVKAMCLSGDGTSFAWGVHLGSVKRALVGLSHGRCSCGARFHMREQ